MEPSPPRTTLSAVPCRSFELKVYITANNDGSDSHQLLTQVMIMLHTGPSRTTGAPSDLRRYYAVCRRDSLPQETLSWRRPTYLYCIQAFSGPVDQQQKKARGHPNLTPLTFSRPTPSSLGNDRGSSEAEQCLLRHQCCAEMSIITHWRWDQVNNAYKRGDLSIVVSKVPGLVFPVYSLSKSSP